MDTTLHTSLQGSCHCGAVSWECSEVIESVTACNCTLCRKYGALWAYGTLDQSIRVSGKTNGYLHTNNINAYHSCIRCGCVTHYLAAKPDAQGNYRAAINVRMAKDYERIADLPIDHFDGLDSFDDLPQDHRTVKDLWF